MVEHFHLELVEQLVAFGERLPAGGAQLHLDAALGGQGVLDTARVRAGQSHIAASHLTLVNRQDTYAHNDPSSASPNNEFVNHLIPFLGSIARCDSCGRKAG